MITLHSFNISPYASKVRAILRYKGLPFDEKLVHPLKRKELQRLSGQIAVPVLEEDGQVIADSTRIARFLDEKHPEKPILPRDPALRARAVLLEEWADEGLARVVQPVRWLIPENCAKTMALFRSTYPKGVVEDLVWKAIGRVLPRDMHKKYGPRTGKLTRAQIRERLAEVCEMMDAVMKETGWLVGPTPTVADFAAFGFLGFVDGLDGWDLIEQHPRVAHLVRTLGPAPTIGKT